MDLQQKVRVVEDFPKKGISFKDITTLLKDKEAYHYTVDTMVHLQENCADVVVAGSTRIRIRCASCLRAEYGLCIGKKTWEAAF